MTKSKPRPTSLSLLAMVAAVPTLPAAVPALSPLRVAWANASKSTSLQSLAQVVARGEDMVTPEHLSSLILAKRRDFSLIDVRAQQEFVRGHIQGAVNISIPKLLEPTEVVRLRRMPRVILYGDNTARAAEAATLLRVAGVPALTLEGGLVGWTQHLRSDARRPETAAIVRALNLCPEITPASIAPLVPNPTTAPTTSAPSAVPSTPKGKAPVNLNGMCG